MVNRLYISSKVGCYGLTLVLLLLCQSLYAQNDIVKDLDSLANLLEQAEGKIIDSSKVVSKKPLTKAQPKKQLLPRKKQQQEATKKEAKQIDSVIQKGKQAAVDQLTGGKLQDNKDLSDVKKEGENESPQDKLEKISDLVSGDNIFYSIIFLLFGYIVVKVLSFVLNALAERSPSYRIAFKGAIPIIKIATWVAIITLIIVVVFRPSITTMLAFSASIGVAVGFASQDILKNVFGGIVILLDRPFVSGDKIEVDKYYGEVVEIGLRSTRIVTPDDSLVSVPNAVMMSGSVSNANSGELNCQVVAEIFLPNDVDTQEVRSLATEAASVSKYIYLGKPITILFFHEMNQTKSYMKMKVKAYVMDTRDEFKFKSDMTELIIKELVKKGVLE